MKKSNLYPLFVALMFAASAVFYASCTKEGPQGPPGEDGIDGTDGTATCGQCHNFTENTTARILQWENSTHANGGNYERNGTSCAPCHTSKGFREVLATGAMETETAISNPTNINCYTCHDIHQTYTASDWALATAEPLVMWQGGHTFDGGTGNLCANCHQMRTFTMPDASDPSGDYTVSSSRFGPHHGPQSAMLMGVNGYGVETSPNPHFSKDHNTCVGCHMAEPYGAQAGGHTWNTAYAYHGHTELLTAGCLASGCHTNEDLLLENYEELEAEIQALIDTLYPLLVDAGIANPETGLANPGTYTNDVAGAYFNYVTVALEDRSNGIHNPFYIKNMLETALESLQ